MSAATSPSIIDVSALGFGWVLSFSSTCVAAGLSPAALRAAASSAPATKAFAPLSKAARKCGIASRG